MIAGFDHGDRMKSFDGPEDENDATYTFYPHSWARHSKTVGEGDDAVVTKFLYDGDNVVAEYDEEAVNKATFVTPFLDQNLAVTIPAGQPDAGTYYYHADGLGSIRNITDATGVVLNTHDYEAFGQAYTSGTSQTVPNDYTFTARRRDAESGLMYYRNRQYAAKLGRFLSRDPLFGGSPWSYQYVTQRPATMTDPLGLVPRDVGGQVARVRQAVLLYELAEEIDNQGKFQHPNDAKAAANKVIWELGKYADFFTDITAILVTGTAGPFVSAVQTGLDVAEAAVEEGAGGAIREAVEGIAGPAGGVVGGYPGEKMGELAGGAAEELLETPPPQGAGSASTFAEVGKCLANGSVSWTGTNESGTWQFYVGVYCCCEEDPKNYENARANMSGTYDGTVWPTSTSKSGVVFTGSEICP